MIYIRTVYRHDVKSFEDNTSIFYRSQRVEFINVEQRVLSDSFSAISFQPCCTMYRRPRMSRSTIFSSTVFSPFFASPFLFFFPSSIFFPPQKFPLFPIYSIRFSRYKLRKGLRRCSKASSSSNNGIVTKVMQFGNYDTRYFFFFPPPPSLPLFSESVGRK